jgi:predicted cytidylate kinase
VIITISGLHGTGKSTVGKLVAKALDMKYYSTGQAFRDLAKEHGMNLQEFTNFAEKNPEIDKELDKKILKIAEKGNILIDSQLSGHILKDVADYKIHLTCSVETRVKRMTDRDNSNYDSKFNETLLRENSELNRFKLLYDIDLSNQEVIKTIHDLVINTENLSIDDVVSLILSKIKS